MRRSAFWFAVIIAFGLCAVPARASTLTPEETKWALRARAVWRAYRLDWDSKAKLRQAERTMLAAGSRREATANLQAVLRKLSLSDPARYPIGFTMALLDLGYEDGREVLLRYLRSQQRADGEPYGVPVEMHSIIADPNDNPAEPDIATDTDGLAGMVYTVYRRHQDPVLLSALLDLAEHADGCVAELMWGVLHNLARDYPRGLLAGLRGKPEGVWQRTADSLAIATQHGPGYSHIPVDTEYAQMSRIAKSKRDPLRKTARRLLDDVRAEQRRRGMGSQPKAPRATAAPRALPPDTLVLASSLAAEGKVDVLLPVGGLYDGEWVSGEDWSRKLPIPARGTIYSLTEGAVGRLQVAGLARLLPPPEFSGWRGTYQSKTNADRLLAVWRRSGPPVRWAKARPLKADSSQYGKLAHDYMVAHGLNEYLAEYHLPSRIGEQVAVTQAVAVDLDYGGKEETLLSANWSYLNGPDAPLPGTKGTSTRNYLLLVRGGGREVVALSGPEDFDPAEEILGCADLDLDGRAEVITKCPTAHEGFRIYTWAPPKVVAHYEFYYGE